MQESEFSSELSEDDKQHGFEFIWVSMVDSLTLESLKERKVIAKILSGSDLIVKLNNPFTGGVSYKHKRYGTSATSPFKQPEWYPVGDEIFPTAFAAVIHCELGASTDPYFQITPHDFKSRKDG